MVRNPFYTGTRNQVPSGNSPFNLLFFFFPSLSPSPKKWVFSSSFLPSSFFILNPSFSLEEVQNNRKKVLKKRRRRRMQPVLSLTFSYIQSVSIKLLSFSSLFPSAYVVDAVHYQDTCITLLLIPSPYIPYLHYYITHLPVFCLSENVQRRRRR